MVDFLMENVEVYEEFEIKKSGLMIDFQSSTSAENALATNWEVAFSSTPETPENYRKGFNLIQNHLKAGNTYLANYTCRSEIQTNLTLEEIFRLARAKYKVYVPEKFVCFSPETFVEIRNGRIFTHPMKGTIDATIDGAIEILKNDPKEKAEHYTVVDLLRNDLSMVADEVKVDEFQRIDLIRTNRKDLYTMSSEISGNIKPEFQGKIGSIFARRHFCGCRGANQKVIATISGFCKTGRKGSRRNRTPGKS